MYALSAVEDSAKPWASYSPVLALAMTAGFGFWGASRWRRKKKVSGAVLLVLAMMAGLGFVKYLGRTS